MTMIIENEKLEILVDWKLAELDEAFENEPFVEYIDLKEHTNENDELYYLIQIADKSDSLTTIKCDKVGYNIHWGSSTPVFIKSIIENVMNGE
ncbi:hypothetical protein [Metabacillus litoralis]|uniref:hypothetical protein n=1 Tax=Metabacillus litoralis TaxID=152268 RepID=UPI00203C6D2C|nr:hypothetical protein [Metabacillus litoralis]MCM3411868.1 hypothetical protein [Metabacillus litoralis]